VNLDEGLPAEDEIRVVQLLRTVLSRWRLVAVTAIVLALLTAAYSMTMQPLYLASTSFMPKQSAQSGLPSSLSGLATQFGVSLGAGPGGLAPRQYAAILKSRAINEQVLLSRYAKPDGGKADSATLLDILKVGGANQAARLENGVKAVGGNTAIGVDALNGIVSLAYTSTDRDLSAAVANRFVDQLNDFNERTNRESARERNVFVQDQLAEAANRLNVAEKSLRDFYNANRSWNQSADLRLSEEALRRKVDVQQEVYLTLAREAEQTRIQASNDAAAITVIDRAVAPVLRSAPRRKFMVMVALVLGVVLGALLAIALDVARHIRLSKASAATA
jgi:uncharacterized protein involved in exopolysaccharide biosynthesis